MAASIEWQEWHLTARGWVRGSYQLDFQKAQIVVPPEDRTLSVRYTEEISHPFRPMRKRTQVLWRISDETLVRELLGQHGGCPEEL